MGAGRTTGKAGGRRAVPWLVLALWVGVLAVVSPFVDPVTAALTAPRDQRERGPRPEGVVAGTAVQGAGAGTHAGA